MPVLYPITYCKPESKCCCIGVYSSLYKAQKAVIQRFKPRKPPYPDCHSIYKLADEVCRFTYKDHTFIISEEVLDRPFRAV